MMAVIFWLYQDISDEDDCVGGSEDFNDIFTAINAYKRASVRVQQGRTNNARLTVQFNNSVEGTLCEIGTFTPQFSDYGLEER